MADTRTSLVDLAERIKAMTLHDRLVLAAELLEKNRTDVAEVLVASAHDELRARRRLGYRVAASPR